MSVETYKKSMEIEFFLRNTLKPKPGSSTDRSLKDYYQSIVRYEGGTSHFMTPSQYKKHFERFVNLFDKAIAKLTNASNKVQAERIRNTLRFIQDSQDILVLFEQVKGLRADK